jgi:hypothetical protein
MRGLFCISDWIRCQRLGLSPLSTSPTGRAVNVSDWIRCQRARMSEDSSSSSEMVQSVSALPLGGSTTCCDTTEAVPRAVVACGTVSTGAVPDAVGALPPVAASSAGLRCAGAGAFAGELKALKASAFASSRDAALSPPVEAAALSARPAPSA